MLAGSERPGLLPTSLCPGLGDGNVERPLLPADVLVGLAKEVRLSPFLLEELHDNLASTPGLVGAVYRTHERKSLLLDERLEIDIVDGRQREVE